MYNQTLTSTFHYIGTKETLVKIENRGPPSIKSDRNSIIMKTSVK